jgi:tRNA(Phe) wybutosine-synthesizing methylase Tyw3
MKKLVCITCLLVFAFGFSQDYDGIEANAKEESVAVEMAGVLEAKLGLTAKQRVLVADNYAEFIAKKNVVIKSDRTIDEKNEVLLALYREQAKELNDVFTLPQRARFKKIREDYDPLIVIMDKK